MPHDECGAGSVETDEEPPEQGALSEAAFVELVRQHRAKVLSVNGRLLWDRHQLVLMLDGGGSWVLDGPPKLSRLVGKRVTVEGTRFDFNGINVQRFKTEDADWPPDRAWTKFKRWMASTGGLQAWAIYLVLAVELGRLALPMESLSSILFKHFMHL